MLVRRIYTHCRTEHYVSFTKGIEIKVRLSNKEILYGSIPYKIVKVLRHIEHIFTKLHILIDVKDKYGSYALIGKFYRKCY